MQVYAKTYPPSSKPTPESGLFVTDKMSNLLFDGIPYKLFEAFKSLKPQLEELDIDLDPEYKIEVNSILDFLSLLISMHFELSSDQIQDRRRMDC